MLVENRGETVGKDRVLQEVWGPTADENYLAQSISNLREALGDTAQARHLIKTIPGEGYRFIGCVTEVCVPLPPIVPRRATPRRRMPRLGLAAAGTTLVVLLTCLYLWEHRPTTPGQSATGTPNYRDLPGFTSPSLLAWITPARGTTY